MIKDQEGFRHYNNWYKGNLHSHTTNSDGKLSPGEAVRLFKRQGYSFLCFSEHDLYTDWTQELNRENFIILPGIEGSAILYEKDSDRVLKTHHIHGILGTEEMRKKAVADVFSQMDYPSIFRQEARTVLEWLKQQGYRLALASSTQMDIIQRVLRENQIGGYFSQVVSGGQFRRSKPDPEIYHYTAARLGVKESRCFVVEDSTFGITAAKRAGMTVAALEDDRFGFDQSGADFRIRDLREIPDCLKQL